MHCRLGSSYSGLRSALLYPLQYLPLVFGIDPMLLDKHMTYMEYSAVQSSRAFKVEGMGSASLPLVPSSPGYICHCNAKAQIRNCLQQSSGEHPCGESAVLGCNREQSMAS